MSNIEVGDYVRSKINGLLSKVTDIETFEELGQIVERYILDNNYNKGFCSTEKDSVIVSKNIIDLIEVGDYVNGEKVIRLFNPTFLSMGELPYLITEKNKFEEYEIKSIVTKKMYESVEYRVGE